MCSAQESPDQTITHEEVKSRDLCSKAGVVWYAKTSDGVVSFLSSSRRNVDLVGWWCQRKTDPWFSPNANSLGLNRDMRQATCRAEGLKSHKEQAKKKIIL